ncbi:hypothetical protein ABH937_003848 [Kitasatospora sp. GAS1066B]
MSREGAVFWVGRVTARPEFALLGQGLAPRGRLLAEPLNGTVQGRPHGAQRSSQYAQSYSDNIQPTKSDGLAVFFSRRSSVHGGAVHAVAWNPERGRETGMTPASQGRYQPSCPATGIRGEGLRAPSCGHRWQCRLGCSRSGNRWQQGPSCSRAGSAPGVARTVSSRGTGSGSAERWDRPSDRGLRRQRRTNAAAAFGGRCNRYRRAGTDRWRYGCIQLQVRWRVEAQSGGRHQHNTSTQPARPRHQPRQRTKIRHHIHQLPTASYHITPELPHLTNQPTPTPEQPYRTHQHRHHSRMQRPLHMTHLRERHTTLPTLTQMLLLTTRGLLTQSTPRMSTKPFHKPPTPLTPLPHMLRQIRPTQPLTRPIRQRRHRIGRQPQRLSDPRRLLPMNLRPPQHRPPPLRQRPKRPQHRRILEKRQNISTRRRSTLPLRHIRHRIRLRSRPTRLHRNPPNRRQQVRHKRRRRTRSPRQRLQNPRKRLRRQIKRLVRRARHPPRIPQSRPMMPTKQLAIGITTTRPHQIQKPSIRHILQIPADRTRVNININIHRRSLREGKRCRHKASSTSSIRGAPENNAAHKWSPTRHLTRRTPNRTAAAERAPALLPPRQPTTRSPRPDADDASLCRRQKTSLQQRRQCRASAWLQHTTKKSDTPPNPVMTNPPPPHTRPTPPPTKHPKPKQHPAYSTSNPKTHHPPPTTRTTGSHSRPSSVLATPAHAPAGAPKSLPDASVRAGRNLETPRQTSRLVPITGLQTRRQRNRTRASQHLRSEPGRQAPGPQVSPPNAPTSKQRHHADPGHASGAVDQTALTECPGRAPRPVRPTATRTDLVTSSPDPLPTSPGFVYRPALWPPGSIARGLRSLARVANAPASRARKRGAWNINRAARGSVLRPGSIRPGGGSTPMRTRQGSDTHGAPAPPYAGRHGMAWTDSTREFGLVVTRSGPNFHTPARM